MRTCAQLVSYEVSLALSVLGVVIMAQSLSLTEIVAAQDDWWYIVPQFVGFVVFMFAGTAETARAPVRPARRPSRSSSPATTPSTAACASASSRWPSTST